MIESTFGLRPLTARDANAMDLRQVLNRKVRQPVPDSAIPTSSQVPGPTSDAAASAAPPASSRPPGPGLQRRNERRRARPAAVRVPNRNRDSRPGPPLPEDDGQVPGQIPAG